MIQRIFTRVLTGVALFCASIAWSCWAYLNTVADPHRVERVADAVLDDNDARLELGSALGEQIVEQAGLDPALQAQISDAVVAVLADERITANLTDAVGSAHARSFGVPDPRPGTIDGALLLTAVRDHLALASPEVAGLVPTELFDELTVPEVKVPFAARLRDLAQTLIAWFGAAALGLLTFSFLAGDRPLTLRRYGYWAIGAGLFWAVGPRLVVLAARALAPSIDATLAAGVGAATHSVTVAAMILMATGVAALAGGFALRRSPASRPEDRAARARLRPARRVEPASTPPVAPPAQRRPAPIVDVIASADPTLPVVVVRPGPSADTRPVEVVDVDPWAHYAAPLPKDPLSP